MVRYCLPMQRTAALIYSRSETYYDDVFNSKLKGLVYVVPPNDKENELF